MGYVVLTDVVENTVSIRGDNMRTWYRVDDPLGCNQGRSHENVCSDSHTVRMHVCAIDACARALSTVGVPTDPSDKKDWNEIGFAK